MTASDMVSADVTIAVVLVSAYDCPTAYPRGTRPNKHADFK